MRTRRTVGIGVLVGLLAAGSTGSARADDEGGEPIHDPALQPAQFVQPVGPYQPPPGSTVVSPGSTAPDPPTPVVRLHVHAPSHVAPGKDVPYRITVTNASAATAYMVRVRNPLPPGTNVTKAEPPPKGFDPKVPSKELVWAFGKLTAGESKVIELSLRPSAEVQELDNKAFVSFEHGQEVGTKVDKPKLLVRKAAPKQSVAPDPITVRVEVTNTGKVAVANVKLVENVSSGFEFKSDGDAEPGAGPGQRIWNLGTLRAGERKQVEYKLTGNGPGELLATSAVSSPDSPEPERTESTTKVLVPGLSLDLKGPPGVQAGETGRYVATVTNTGTIPLSDVRISVPVPAECKPTMITNGGQPYRDRIVWTVPDRKDEPLKPGQSFEVKFGLKAATSGQRTVRVTADAGRGVEQSREVSTAFQATAVLNWKASLDRQTIPAGREGLLTVRVQNSGGEPARNTRLRIELPSGILADEEVSPRRYQAAAGEIVFDAVSIPAGGSETYTVTFVAKRPGSAWFRLKLSADALGDLPLTKEQEVQITAKPGSRDLPTSR